MKSRLIKIFVLFVLFIGVVNTVNADDGILLESNAIDTVLNEKSINKSEFISLAGGTPTLGNIVYACMTMKNNSESECKSLVNDIVAEHNKKFEKPNQESGAESVVVSGTDEKINGAEQSENEELAELKGEQLKQVLPYLACIKQEHNGRDYVDNNFLWSPCDAGQAHPYRKCKKPCVRVQEDETYKEYAGKEFYIGGNGDTVIFPSADKGYIYKCNAETVEESGDTDYEVEHIKTDYVQGPYFKWDNGNCVVTECDDGYKLQGNTCVDDLSAKKELDASKDAQTDNIGKDTSLAKTDDTPKKTSYNIDVTVSGDDSNIDALAFTGADNHMEKYANGQWSKFTIRYSLGDDEEGRQRFRKIGFEKPEADYVNLQKAWYWTVKKGSNLVFGNFACSGASGAIGNTKSSLGRRMGKYCWCSNAGVNNWKLLNIYGGQDDCERGCSKYCAEQVLNGNASF